MLEQSGTADSPDDTSGGTEAPTKKVKITLTEEEENFVEKFRPATSKIDKEREIPLPLGNPPTTVTTRLRQGFLH